MNYRAVWCTIVFAALVLLLEGCSAPSTLTSIQVTPSTAALAAVGTTVQFTAMGTYSNGRHPSETRDITGSVTWASSTPQPRLSVPLGSPHQLALGLLL
jgi:hypothetical protein